MKIDINIPDSIQQRASTIQWLVLDVDGVMTDGSLIRGDDGQEYKRFSARDGLGMRLCRDAGLNVAIITARSSKLVADRAAELGVSEIHQGKHDKLTVLKDMCKRLDLAPEQVAFMGDDLVDYAAMAFSGLALTVADAYPPMLSHAHWVSQYPGGRGAVREACELILASQGKLEAAVTAITGTRPA